MVRTSTCKPGNWITTRQSTNVFKPLYAFYTTISMNNNKILITCTFRYLFNNFFYLFIYSFIDLSLIMIKIIVGPNYWLIDWLIGWLIDWLIDRLIDLIMIIYLFTYSFIYLLVFLVILINSSENMQMRFVCDWGILCL